MLSINQCKELLGDNFSDEEINQAYDSLYGLANAYLNSLFQLDEEPNQ